MSAVSHPRFAPRRAARARSWWGRAWQRAVEEAADSEADLRRGRALARAGGVGAVTVGAGTFAAAVDEGDGAWPVTGGAPVLDDGDRALLAELVRAEPGRVAALLAGDLPSDLVEQAEGSGVELLPDGVELATTCGCDGWADPCRHALAVLTALGWLVDADPLVLLGLRGLPRDLLLAGGQAAGPDDVEVALDAALRAARALAVLESGGDPGHLL